MKAPSRIAKSVVITNLVNSIRDSSTQPHGGFVRFDTSCGLWYEVGEKVARDKVGQALRDAARLQDEKQKSRTVDLSPSLSSHCQQDGQCQVVAEPNIFELEEEVSGGENNDVSMGKHSSRHSAIKWAHTEYIGKFSPASPTTSNNEDTHPRAGKNRSFWFRRNALQMPAYNSSNEVTTAFAESADEDITSIDDHDQQQHRQHQQQELAPGASSTMLFSSDDDVLLPSSLPSLPSSPALPSSSLGGILETADFLLEWFENDNA
ncbi:unnamed protein product [Cylindrotheca closterium]|uniref:DUF6824 domain-containing protein n=1 Tax=Cylindrotheca closterium TaxID=2856 RepID=A0AAD2CCQ5_9STRA|nr:unnamed protein product [Cylindrotheca closterium]